MNIKKLKPIKLLLIGDSCVGKTSLLLRFCDNFFPESHMATIGVEFKEKIITINDKNYKIHLWDTAGQERYSSLTKNFYKHAQGIIFVYDVNNRESFQNLKNWIKNPDYEKRNVKIIIVGNKIDLKKEISTDDLKRLANRYSCKYFEVSAKNNINVNSIFESITEEIINDNKEYDEDIDSITLSNVQFYEKEKKKTMLLT